MQILSAAFQNEGLTELGAWNDDDLLYLVRLLANDTHRINAEESLTRCDEILKQLKEKPDRQRLIDDAMLRKAGFLLAAKRWDAASELFNQVRRDFPDGQVDIVRAKGGALPGMAHSRVKYMLCSYYWLKHPNHSASTASLGIAQIAIAQGDYRIAERNLNELIPNQVRVPSEDPLARTPDKDDVLENYLGFMDDPRFDRLVESRTDKIALLWLARVAAVSGKIPEARELYLSMFRLFPCSGQSAIRELQWLDADQLQKIKDVMLADASTPHPKIPFSLSGQKIIEILRLYPPSRQIGEVRSYFEQVCRQERDVHLTTRPQ